MSSDELTLLVKPLVQHGAFSSAEAAVRELVLEFTLRQIDRYRQRISALESRHGLSFEQFSAYLKERSALLTNGHLEPAQKGRVAQAVMSEEEDWLDWKIARDFLEGWLGLKAGASV